MSNLFLFLPLKNMVSLHHRDRKMRSISMENVTGIFRAENEDYLKTFVCSLVGMGMDVRVDVLDSSRWVIYLVFLLLLNKLMNTLI